MSMGKKVSDPDLIAELDKQVEKKSPKKPDFSQQYKRNFGDTLRDVGYGVVHGPWEAGKLLGNVVTGGHLEDIPGYKQYIPFMNEQIEKIKSPYPSPWSGVEHGVGEFAVPGIAAGYKGYKAVKTGLSKLPSLTNRGREAAYNAVNENRIKEGVSTLEYPTKLLKSIKKFYSKHDIETGERLDKLLSGDFEAALDIKNALGKLSRKFNLDPKIQEEAAGLHVDLGKALKSGLKNAKHHETQGALEYADTNYARSMQLQDALKSIGKFVTPAAWIHAIGKHL